MTVAQETKGGEKKKNEFAVVRRTRKGEKRMESILAAEGGERKTQKKKGGPVLLRPLGERGKKCEKREKKGKP